MRNIALVLSTMLLITFSLACSKPAEKPPTIDKASQQGAAIGKTSQGETPIPSTSTTGTTGTIAPGGISSEYNTFEADLKTFLKGVVTNDRALIEAKAAAAMRDRIDTAIKDLGFHEFAKDGDYNALWEKLQTVSNMAYTAVTGDSLVAVWMVNGKEAGFKNLQVQFDMIRDGEEWRVSKYTMLNP